jgi:hypothetical protein
MLADNADRITQSLKALEKQQQALIETLELLKHTISSISELANIVRLLDQKLQALEQLVRQPPGPGTLPPP